MNLIVVGCGRVGAELAHRLNQKGHRVAVIDSVEASFRNLPPDFSGRIVEGDALDQEVLHRAGIETAQGLAAVTNSDTANLVVAHVARTVFQTENIIVRNYDSRLRPLYDVFNLQVVSSSSWGAQRIEELLYHQEVRSVFSAGNGEVEVYEMTIPPEWAGLTLGKLLPPEGCVPTALTRSGRAILPRMDEVLQAGDVLLVSATFEGITALRSNLKDVQEGV
jgi:trk system potassium uptake protein TrkA